MNQGHPDITSGIEVFNRILENPDYKFNRRSFLKLAGLVSASAVVAGCTPGLSNNSNVPLESSIEQTPIFDNPEDTSFHEFLQSNLPVTDIVCSDGMGFQGPGFAPSEAEMLQILSDSGCQIPEDQNSVWKQVADEEQILMYAGMATVLSKDLAVPVAVSPTFWDDLALAGLVAVASGTIAYVAMNKAKKVATSGHSTDKHAPYHPKGGPARYIIDQLSKGTSYCYTIKMLNDQGKIVYRTVVTTGVLNNPYMTLMAWFRNDKPNAWGGAFPYTGNPRDVEALAQTAKGILEVLSIACPQLPPAPNVP